MATINKTGTYRGNILDAGVDKHEKNGLPQWIAQLQAVEYYDEETKQWVDWIPYEEKEIMAYLFLFNKEDKPIFHYTQLQKALGWSGVSFSELALMDCSKIKIQWRVDKDEYGYKAVNVDIYDAEPGRTVRKLNSEDVKKLDAKYANALLQASGGSKPKKVGRKPKPIVPTTPSIPLTGIPVVCTKEQAWDTCCKLRDKSVNDDQLGDVWLKVIGELGGEDAIENWANVRDLVVEQTKDNIPF